MKQTVRRAVALASILILVVAFPGCRHNVNPNNNPAVSVAVSLNDAANACDLMKDGLVAANNVLDKLQLEEPEYYAHAKPIIGKIAQANLAAIATIRLARAGNPAANWQQAMVNVATAAAGEDFTSFNVKNPTSAALLKAAFATLALTLKQFGGGQ